MADPTGIIPDYVTSARDRAESAGNVVTQLATGAYDFKGKIEKAINETLNYNKDIIDARASALSEYLAEPAKANYRYNSATLENGQPNPNYILNPFEANKAIATDTQTKEIPFLSLNDFLGARRKGDQQLVGDAVEGYNAQLTGAKYAYDAAHTTYNDILGEFKIAEDIKAARAKAGSGSSSARTKTIDEAMVDASNKVALYMKANDGKAPSRDVYDSIYAGIYSELSAKGIDPTETEMGYIRSEKENMGSVYNIPQPEAPNVNGVPSFSGGNINPNDIQKDEGFFPSMWGKISDFLHQGDQTVAPNSVDLSGYDFGGVDMSNINRGLSNTNSAVLGGFNPMTPTR